MQTDDFRSALKSTEHDYDAAVLSEMGNGLDAASYVVEIYTLQVLPPTVRPQAMRAIVDLVASKGQLLVITRGREEDEAEGEMPWPLTREELSEFTRLNLEQESFEDYWDQEVPPVYRFRSSYRKSKGCTTPK